MKSVFSYYIVTVLQYYFLILIFFPLLSVLEVHRRRGWCHILIGPQNRTFGSCKYFYVIRLHCNSMLHSVLLWEFVKQPPATMQVCKSDCV